MDYCKGESFKEADVAKKAQPAAAEKNSPSIETTPGYSKGDGVLLPKAFVVIFSGGNVREPNYFRLVASNPSLFPLLKLKILPEDRYYAKHEPRVFSYAETETMAYRDSASEEQPDEYYVLTDVDVFMPHIIHFKPRLTSLGIQMIISNPCFEVWLYYSKRSDKFDGFVKPKNSEAISSEVKKFVHRKTNGINPTKALYNIETNIENARDTYEEDDNGIPALFSTNMYILAERIQPLLRKGLDAMQEEEERRKAMYKSGPSSV